MNLLPCRLAFKELFTDFSRNSWASHLEPKRKGQVASTTGHYIVQKICWGHKQMKETTAGEWNWPKTDWIGPNSWSVINSILNGWNLDDWGYNWLAHSSQWVLMIPCGKCCVASNLRTLCLLYRRYELISTLKSDDIRKIKHDVTANGKDCLWCFVIFL